ncbi:hypothetical protein SE17_21780 [Kouleothrix aurantiaca]|uniref:O-antigen ligase-related domain-containing protein n=1 Tax=Kouleothrix aurantiaca TaxID=186479 RepID=A0A0P9FEE5_9CHLR|nr:hypothetical protein SE17_21780 [Kouleothrix aurantiaca]
MSPYLLYVMYAAVLGSIVASVVLTPPRSYQFRAVMVYGFWLAFYFLWTLLVLPSAREQLPEVIRVLVRNATVLAAIPVVVRNRPNLNRLANGFQLVVLVNCAICIWESLDPTVIWAIANMRAEDISVVDPNRAAALWYNPNPAAFGFLIGALMSRWSRGWLMVAGRIAALVGIYLTVSRSGLYMLLLCGALYGTFRMRGVTMTLRRWVLVAGALALLLGALIGVVAAGPGPLLPENGGGNWNVQRLLDVQEENSGDLSRVQLSEVALRAAMRGPWYGRGTFIFQGSPASPFKAYTNVGAHNIYIVVVGEAGLAGVAGARCGRAIFRCGAGDLARGGDEICVDGNIGGECAKSYQLLISSGAGVLIVWNIRRSTIWTRMTAATTWAGTRFFCTSNVPSGWLIPCWRASSCSARTSSSVCCER